MYKEGLIKLNNRPNNLKDFSNQVQTVSNLKDDEKSMYKATSQADQLYNLLRQYDVKVPPEDLVLHEDLHERQQEFRKEIDSAQAYRDSKIPEMVTTVEANIMKLQDQVSGTVLKLDDEMFTEVEHFEDPDKALDELNQLGQRLENADQLAKTYASYQKLFNVPVTVQKELEAGKEKWETMKGLWETIKNWTEKSKFWLDTQFTELQVEEVDKDLQLLFKESFSLNKKLGFKVSELLKDKISDFKTIMPNILDLGNPNMRNRHFEKLFKLEVIQEK
jgi:DNA repair ATPase RecN